MKHYILFLFSVFLVTTQLAAQYETLCSHTFCIDLPTGFIAEEDQGEGESALDYEYYEIKTADGFKIMEVNSLIQSHFNLDSSIYNIVDWYNYLVAKRAEISYKMQKDNWFVISGIDPESGNIYYWKKIWDTNWADENSVSESEFVLDLYIEYPPARKKEIEPHIGRISRSFVLR